MARPSKFNEQLRETIFRLYKEGKTDEQVAEIIGVSSRTLNNWKGKHPTFLQALKEGKQVADALVEASLFGRAVGHTHRTVEEVLLGDKVVKLGSEKYYPPDPTSAIFWLKNRQPEKWREDKAAVTINNFDKMTDEQLDKMIAEKLAKQEKSE